MHFAKSEIHPGSFWCIDMIGIKYGNDWIEKRIYDVIVFKEEIDGFKGSAKTKIRKWDDPMVGWGP